MRLPHQRGEVDPKLDGPQMCTKLDRVMFFAMAPIGASHNKAVKTLSIFAASQGSDEFRTKGPSLVPGSSGSRPLGGDDVQGYRELDLRVEVYLDFVEADCLDRGGDNDVLLLQVDTSETADSFDDVSGRNRSV